MVTRGHHCLRVALQGSVLQRVGGWNRDWYLNLRVLGKNAGAIGWARRGSPRHGDLGAVRLFVGWERNGDRPIRG